MAKPKQEEVIIEGKTKIITRLDERLVRVTSKPDITAGDGAKKDSFAQKDVFATSTTCRVFELLRACDVPVAYEKQLSPNEFAARHTRMVPLEIVARRIIGEKSSYRKRHPYINPGYVAPTLIVEFFLKTTNRKYLEHEFAKDDPLIDHYNALGDIVIRRPDIPRWQEDGNPVIKLPLFRRANERLPFKEAEDLVRKTFLVLEGAWNTLGKRLCDLKIEVGYTKSGTLVVSDVIDADSWRLLDEHGNSLDKQSYRDGAALEQVANIYEHVAALVERFSAMHAKANIVLWSASQSDDTEPFRVELDRLNFPANLHLSVGSVHKNPETSLEHFRFLVSRPADTVVIVRVGRSNGAGPIFACDTQVPVIACPAGLDAHPEDLWSSINLPSNCPLLVQTNPANAIQAALGILSARSPQAYAARRAIVESAHLSTANSPSFNKPF